jgi:hypothetical protein
MGQEMAKPTGLLAHIIEEAIRPMRKVTEEILVELLDGQASPQVMRLCEISIIGPCMMIVRRQHLHPRGPRGGFGPEFTPDKLEEMVEHFTTFTLAGVAAIKARGEKSEVSNLNSETSSQAGES